MQRLAGPSKRKVFIWLNPWSLDKVYFCSLTWYTRQASLCHTMIATKYIDSKLLGNCMVCLRGLWRELNCCQNIFQL